MPCGKKPGLPYCHWYLQKSKTVTSSHSKRTAVPEVDRDPASELRISASSPDLIDASACVDAHADQSNIVYSLDMDEHMLNIANLPASCVALADRAGVPSIRADGATALNIGGLADDQVHVLAAFAGQQNDVGVWQVIRA